MNWRKTGCRNGEPCLSHSFFEKQTERILMQILAVDPGTDESGWLVYDTEKKLPILFDIWKNEKLLASIEGDPIADHMAIEKVQHYGHGVAVGAEVYDTCFWIGRFDHAFGMANTTLLTRKKVAGCLCNTGAAKSKNIRQALIDYFGGDSVAIGNKKCHKCKGKGWFGPGRPTCPVCNGDKWKYPPGPLCGIHDHIWSALAVAITWVEVYGKGVK